MGFRSTISLCLLMIAYFYFFMLQSVVYIKIVAKVISLTFDLYIFLLL